MTTKEIRTSIHTMVDEVKDSRVLKAYRDILTNLREVSQRNAAIGYDASGHPISPQQLEKDVLAASKRVKAGRYVTQEELNNEVENW